MAASRSRSKVAFGVLGLMLLVFISIVFMLGHHATPDIFLHLDDHPLFHPRHNNQQTAIIKPDTSHLNIKATDKEVVTGAVKNKEPIVTVPKKEEAAKVIAKAENSVAQKPTVVAPKKEEAVKIVAKTETPKKEAAVVVPKKEVASTVAKKEEPVKTVTQAKTDTNAAKGGLSQLDLKYKPSVEMVNKYKQDGYLVVTWANYHYYDFVVTWAKHIKEVGVTGYIIGAMDDNILEHLISADLHCFSMRSGLTLGDFGWGSKTFAKMGREKIRLISVFLKLGTDVIIADVDVLFLRNPIPFFQRYPEADVLTSSDHLMNTVNDESLEIWPQAASAANIGIMLFRNKSLSFVEKWISVIEADETVWDQNAFNDLFRRGNSPILNDPKHLFMGYQNSLKMGILPVALFASGHTFFTQRMYQKLGLKPYALHATFQFSGTAGKRHRMREFMMWEDPPEYYDSPAGFVSFVPNIPADMVNNSSPRTNQMNLANTVGHFKLINHQVLQIRNALALATMTGRVAVMPQMWCGLDRWWAPHSGRIPGSGLDLPYPCPLDHVFDLEGGWTRKLATQEFGPDIDFREYSFFNNPKMPASVKSNKVIVEVCAAGAADCSNGDSPAPVVNGKVRIQPGLLSNKLQVALQNTKPFKVVEFSTMLGAFGNFSMPDEWRRFEARMKIYASIWCCVAAHPGHIHYDMLFDVPHKDKFGRTWNGTWEPKCGP